MMIAFYKVEPMVYREALLKETRAPSVVQMSDGRWLVRQPLPDPLDGITAYLILGGPYRWRWWRDK